MADEDKDKPHKRHDTDEQGHADPFLSCLSPRQAVHVKDHREKLKQKVKDKV